MRSQWGSPIPHKKGKCSGGAGKDESLWSVHTGIQISTVKDVLRKLGNTNQQDEREIH